jgi:hypothetical protein
VGSIPQKAGVCRNMYRGADTPLARSTSRCILFDGESISFDTSVVIVMYK